MSRVRPVSAVCRPAVDIVDSTTETDEYGDLEAEYDVVVTDERDTASWAVSEPGTADRNTDG
ncbi:hypothetical protein RBH26_00535 [Natronolimnohabitans sp. A-GB9]|uniref:hypothetical protein n=1 Tax=Natronolimnohabitans sp. A-GB9 TaxID=3069757 RepID=UPI0027B2AE04|nr:hypothetical protein [Natronolimnohabitans sp. A-GB9]MDQ2048962.1 hypothetical protein [Natronolimnohabitans sp. A-GB9]